jgi:nucleoside 2-deoxyribosyltransferase
MSDKPVFAFNEKPKIYIASPYAIGDVSTNVRAQIQAFNKLADAGFIPFAPLLWHFQDMFIQRTRESWLELGLQMVLVCDGLVRLGGESTGADDEVTLAITNGIPVFYSNTTNPPIQEMLRFDFKLKRGAQVIIR